MRHKGSRNAQDNLDWGLWEVGKELAQLPTGTLCVGNYTGRDEPETPQSVALAVAGQKAKAWSFTDSVWCIATCLGRTAGVTFFL